MSFLENLFVLFRRMKPVEPQKTVSRASRASQYRAQAALSDRTAPLAREDFVASAVVGHATDNALLGYMAGGSLVGGALGAATNAPTQSAGEPSWSEPEPYASDDSFDFDD